MRNPYTDRLRARFEELKRDLLRRDVTYEQFIEACKTRGSEVFPHAEMERGLINSEAIFEAAKLYIINEIPWKHTVIGPERSMPPKTEIRFITSEELENLKQHN